MQNPPTTEVFQFPVFHSGTESAVDGYCLERLKLADPLQARGDRSMHALWVINGVRRTLLKLST